MEKYSLKNDFLGEVIGSFILVLFGTGSVAAAVLYDWSSHPEAWTTNE